MLAALLLQAGMPQSAVSAERDFAAMAAEKGQWTAFRAFAAPDATMFVPQPVKAQTWLKDRKDPPHAVRWQLAATYASCDGKLAVNTGNWQGEGVVGYFTTLWASQPGGAWKWMFDHGDPLKAPRVQPAMPGTARAVCVGKPKAAPLIAWREGPSEHGASPDGTLAWQWHVSSSGARQVVAWLWDGRDMTKIIDDQVAAAPQ
jgi:hypothetical protein